MKLASWVCKQPGIRDIEVYGDSVLIICQTVEDQVDSLSGIVGRANHSIHLHLHAEKNPFAELRWSRSQKEPEARGEPARPANKIVPGHLPAKMKIRKNLISLKPTLEKDFLEHRKEALVSITTFNTDTANATDSRRTAGRRSSPGSPMGAVSPRRRRNKTRKRATELAAREEGVHGPHSKSP